MRVPRLSRLLAVLTLALGLPISAQAAGTLLLENNCSVPVTTFFVYTGDNGARVSTMGYRLQPGARNTIFSTGASTYYYFAIAPGRHWSGDIYLPASDGTRMPFREKTIDEAEEVLSLSCDNTYADTERLELRVHSECSDTMYVAMRYKTLDDEWETFAWRRIEPHEFGFFPATRNGIIYIYGETEKDSDGGFVSWKGSDRTYTIDGESYDFFRYDDLREKAYLTLSCD